MQHDLYLHESYLLLFVSLIIVQGEWVLPKTTLPIVDPWNGEVFMHVADTKENELQPFIDSLSTCTKSGLHNPLKHPERYKLYGAVSSKAAYLLKQPEVNIMM